MPQPSPAHSSVIISGSRQVSPRTVSCPHAAPHPRQPAPLQAAWEAVWHDPVQGRQAHWPLACQAPRPPRATWARASRPGASGVPPTGRRALPGGAPRLWRGAAPPSDIRASVGRLCSPPRGATEERQSQDPAPGEGWLAPKRGHVTGCPGHARAPGPYARSEGGRVLGRLGPAGCSAGNRPGGALEGPRVLSDPRALEGPLPGGSGRSPELDATSDTCRAAGGRLPRARTLHAGLAGAPSSPPAPPVRPCMRQCWLTWAARRARRLC